MSKPMFQPFKCLGCLCFFGLLSLQAIFSQIPDQLEGRLTRHALIVSNVWPAGDASSAGMFGDTDYYKVHTTSSPARSLLDGYQLTIDYRLNEQWQLGLELSHNNGEAEADMVYTLDTTHLFGRRLIEELPIQAYREFDFTTLTFFARRLLPWGFYVQGGWVYREWEELHIYRWEQQPLFFPDFNYLNNRLTFVWPKQAWQLAAGWQYKSDTGLYLKAGVAGYFGGKVRFKKESIYNTSNTGSMLLNPIIKESVSGRENITGLSFDVGISF